MSAVASARRVELCPGDPEVHLLETDAHPPDEAALREWARSMSDGVAHVSRSYRWPYALVAWHVGRVGVDIERLEPGCDPAFLQSICTPFERGRVAVDDALSLWSSKEALAKALGDALAYDPRRLGSPALWPDGRSGPWRAARVAVPDGHVGWVCWEAPPTDRLPADW